MSSASTVVPYNTVIFCLHKGYVLRPCSGHRNHKYYWIPNVQFLFYTYIHMIAHFPNLKEQKIHSSWNRIYNNNNNLIKEHDHVLPLCRVDYWAFSDDAEVKSASCSCRGTEFVSQHWCEAASASKNLTPLSAPPPRACVLTRIYPPTNAHIVHV